MMMPVLDQGPAHHHHGHGHQTLYHQPHLSEQTGKMQLTLILPNGVPSVLNVDTTTPMMDLLVQATSLNKLNPSGYSLVVLDANQHVIQFKPNQTVGQIVKSCQLPQMNGSSTISLLPKETLHSNSSPKTKTQPFEITVRLQVNLPDAQKILIRVDPTLPLHEIKEQICKQKKYLDSNRYTLRLPNKLEQPLLLGLSLAEYKTNELTLLHLKTDHKFTSNQMQSFDRLYRLRSESQPAEQTVEETQHEQQTSPTNNKQRPASVQPNATRSPTQGHDLKSATTRPITSHTSLHAYWNDPNFDTQSQGSNCSSTTKKRRAPKPPDHISPIPDEQQIITSEMYERRESHESLTESTKQKRKAPTIPTTPSKTDEEEITTTVLVHDQPAGSDADQKLTIIIDSNEQDTPANENTVELSSPDGADNNKTNSSTPIYSQIQKSKEPVQSESPYSAVQISPTPPVPQREDIVESSSKTHTVEEIVQAGIADPPAIVPVKSSKSKPSLEGLTKMVNDHRERADLYQEAKKQAENVTYFRVAKSRCGKFETNAEGFVNNETNVFESTKPDDNNKQQLTEKSIVIKSQNTIDSSHSPTHEQMRVANYKEKSPTPIQLEVTERTTHISVTVESDGRQLITRASPILQQTTISPPAVAPKPSGKTITEYRTVRRIGTDGEIRTTTTVHTETVPSNSTETKAAVEHESSPTFGGSENLDKK